MKYIKSIHAVKEGMFRETGWIVMTDFQDALELGKESVNLAAPNTTLVGIDEISNGSIIEKPEADLIFITEKGKQKLFFRV